MKIIEEDQYGWTRYGYFKTKSAAKKFIDKERRLIKTSKHKPNHRTGIEKKKLGWTAWVSIY